MYAYCLQCLTQRCGAISVLLEKRGADRAFSPQIITRHRKQGKTEDVQYDLFPGYVFVYLEQEPEDLSLFSGITGLIRCLGREYGTKGLQHEDYAIAMDLYRMNGVVGKITALKEGDTVKLKDPLFEAYGGTILHIDHRKQRAKVQLHFDGRDWTIWVACDVLYQEDGKEAEQLTWSQTKAQDGETP